MRHESYMVKSCKHLKLLLITFSKSSANAFRRNGQRGKRERKDSPFKNRAEQQQNCYVNTYSKVLKTSVKESLEMRESLHIIFLGRQQSRPKSEEQQERKKTSDDDIAKDY